ncbi:tetratricopeptide repeat protein [Paenibacillus hamazuiensis]|uniref:tetratricopeptide repeat protein n=1 Tax=Paenibacillus hamazuiensis TaxID=2936508 RepID=UPI00200F2456|nr:tetratricopeptide repeat protein [Paenibacillus hamazuiensis]
MKENKLVLLLIPVLLIAGIWVYYSTRVPDVPQDADSCYSQSLALIQANKNDEAKKQVEGCIGKFPQDGRFDFQLGNIARKQNQMGQALAYYEAALKKSPQLPEVYNNIAAVKMLENKLDEALSVINEGLKQNPDYKDLKFKKGQILYVKQDYAQVIPLLESIANDPEYVEAYRFMGLAQFKQNQKEAAQASLTAYLQKAPQSSQGVPEAQKVLNQIQGK